ncbi:hypothetical protein DAPPUDRAFT_221694 [Daphnia pulex]|uniref:ZP domain-containing protein n=1 Tax=Daphnia pulex TaxID=6669 RepID=E9G069_DAPPU|nr:hypothetical protein DAPPUDRAFT_221694 [Daphnia pulex]|eukprot:EFX86848.1 hypothetical protein DAPPUDRAFT_221694 [Daphnia pulex]
MNQYNVAGSSSSGRTGNFIFIVWNTYKKVGGKKRRKRRRSCTNQQKPKGGYDPASSAADSLQHACNSVSTFQQSLHQIEISGQVDGADLRELKVQCSRSGLTVHVKFDGPFYGIVYSQNYYQVPQCTYVTSDNSQGRTSFSFNVPQKGCGTVSQSGYKKSNNVNTFQRSLDVQPAAAQLENEDISLENTIVIQHDPDFQEAGDTARRLRCVWGAHSLQKSVNAKMPEVYQPSTITVKYDYRTVNQLVEVQSDRRGPLSLPARDSGQRFDANVLSCTYSDGQKGETIQLTDEEGCSLRPDLTTVFYKLKETTNPNTDLTLYTYFRGLKALRESYFSITCNVEICFPRCSERCRNRLA